MVLESIFNPFHAKQKPWEMFFAGLLYSFVSLMLAYFVFKEIAGILTVFFIVLAALPTMYATLQNEEEFDLKLFQESKMLQEHGKAIVFLLFLFLGITVGLVAAYVFLPASLVSLLFSLQEKAIINVNQNIQALITGNIAKFDFFIKILINNLKVLFFCMVFSLIYGTGALFILTWNASVIATAMGNLLKSQLAQTTSLVGFSSLAAYFSAGAFSFFRYMIHGILEISAYFIMGLAGGILSVAIIKHHLEEDRILIDVLDLVLVSVGFLVVAGIVEVYITPVIFN
jgi:uncharacterized membrane protein SpoIIM required for sporulation